MSSPPTIKRAPRFPSPTLSVATANTLGLTNSYDISETESKNSIDEAERSVVGTDNDNKDVVSFSDIEVVESNLRSYSPNPSPSPSRRDMLEMRMTCNRRRFGKPLRSNSPGGSPDSKDEILPKERFAEQKMNGPREKVLLAELTSLRSLKQCAARKHAEKIEVLEQIIVQRSTEVKNLKQNLRQNLDRNAEDLRTRDEEIETLKSQLTDLSARAEVQDEEFETVKRQVASLAFQCETQQEKIEEREKEMQELEEMVIWSETELNSKSGQLDVINQAIESKNCEIDRLKSEVVAIDSISNSRLMELEDMKKLKQLVEGDTDRIVHQVESISNENAELKDKLAICDSERESIAIECKTISEESLYHQGQLTLAHEKISKLCSQLKAKETEAFDLQKRFEIKAAEYSHIYDDLANHRFQITEANNKIHHLELALQAKETEFVTYAKEFEERIESCEHTLALKLDSSTKDASLYSETISRLQNQSSARDSELSSLRKDLEESLENSSNLAAQLQYERNRFRQSKTKNRVLKEEISYQKEDMKIEKEEYRLVSHELVDSKERCAEISRKINCYECEVKTLNDEVIKCRSAVNRESEKSRFLSIKLMASKEKNAATNQKLLDCEEELGSIKKEVLKHKFNLESEVAKVCVLSQELSFSNDRCHSLQARVMDLEVESSLQQKNITAKEESESQLRSDLESRDEMIRCMERDMIQLNETIAKFEIEMAKLKVSSQEIHDRFLECKEESKREMLAECEALRNAMSHHECSLRHKEDEITQYKEDMKNSTAEVSSLKSSVISLRLLNHTVSEERDALRKFKFEVGDKMREQENQLLDMTSQLSVLSEQVHGLQSSIRERDAAVKNFEQELEMRTFVVSQNEDDLLAKTEEVQNLKNDLHLKSSELSDVRVELDSLRNATDQFEKIESLESVNKKAKETLEINNGEIKSLMDQIVNLNSKTRDLELDLERHKVKFKTAKKAIKDLEKTLMAVEEQRQKLVREKANR